MSKAELAIWLAESALPAGRLVGDLTPSEALSCPPAAMPPEALQGDWTPLTGCLGDASAGLVLLARQGRAEGRSYNSVVYKLQTISLYTTGARLPKRCEASARHRDARGEAYSTWRGPRDEREKEAARRREGEREREHEQDVRVRMRVSWGMMIQVLTAALLFVCRYHCCST